MFDFLIVMIVAFLPETSYPRGAMIERGAGALAVEKIDPAKMDLKRTKQLPFLVGPLQTYPTVERSSHS
jgi:hypothetical protein